MLLLTACSKEAPSAPARDNPLDLHNLQTGGDPYGLQVESTPDGPRLRTLEEIRADILELEKEMARTQPGLKGFTRRNLFRMRQFYETYRDDEKVSALLTQLPWTHHLSIMTAAKQPEERECWHGSTTG